MDVILVARMVDLFTRNKICNRFEVRWYKKRHDKVIRDGNHKDIEYDE